MTQLFFPALKQVVRLSSNVSSTGLNCTGAYASRFYSTETISVSNSNHPIHPLQNGLNSDEQSTQSTQSTTSDKRSKKLITKQYAQRLLSRKRFKKTLLTPAEKQLIDQKLQMEFSKFSHENQAPMESYVDKVPKTRFVLNAFTIGKVLNQSSNFTRYHVEAFTSKEVQNCVAQIRRKQNKLYKYLLNQISVRLNSVVYEILRNYQSAHVPSLQAMLVPGGLFKQQANALDKVRDNMPQGIPLAKLKEAFLLRAFQTYLLQTKHWSASTIPTRRTLITVNRSTHIDKKARDQFELTSNKMVVVCSPFMKIFDHVLQDELAFTGCRVKSIREEDVNHEV